MSTPLVPNEGELDLLTILRAELTPVLRLYKNNYTPVAGSVLADFTQADFSGYPAGGIALTYAAAATNGSGQAAMAADEEVFEHDGGGTANTVYGYYIVNTGTNKVIKAEKFDAAVSMGVLGDKITVNETYLLAGTIT